MFVDFWCRYVNCKLAGCKMLEVKHWLYCFRQMNGFAMEWTTDELGREAETSAAPCGKHSRTWAYLDVLQWAETYN